MAATEADSACASGGLWQGVPLECDRLRLRPLEPGDAAAIQLLAGEWEVARFSAHIPHPYPDGAALSFIAAASHATQRGVGLTYAITRRIGGTLVGVASLVVEDGTGDLDHWIGRPYWGQGYATEAMRRLIRASFRTLGLDRVRAAIHPDNPVSLRVAEKAGMSYRETATKRLPARAQTVEMRIFGTTRAAWENARAKAPLPILLVAAAALIDADGRVLIARRPAGKALAGLWEFPGGKVAAFETPESALCRELREELGIEVKESCLATFTFASHEYDQFHLLMPLYLCRNWQGIPEPREGQELRWVEAARLGDFPMPPADLPLVAMLRDLL